MNCTRNFAQITIAREGGSRKRMNKYQNTQCPRAQLPYREFFGLRLVAQDSWSTVVRSGPQSFSLLSQRDLSTNRTHKGRHHRFETAVEPLPSLVQNTMGRDADHRGPSRTV